MRHLQNCAPHPNILGAFCFEEGAHSQYPEVSTRHELREPHAAYTTPVPRSVRTSAAVFLVSAHRGGNEDTRQASSVAGSGSRHGAVGSLAATQHWTRAALPGPAQPGRSVSGQGGIQLRHHPATDGVTSLESANPSSVWLERGFRSAARIHLLASLRRVCPVAVAGAIAQGIDRHHPCKRLVGHISRDSTAIAARERFPDPPAQPAGKKKKYTKRPKRAKAGERGTLIEKQSKMSLQKMLAGLSTACAIGVKKSSQGHTQYWRGYKLHLDVADGQIPISAIFTGANVHDSQVAIPLMTMTTQRVVYLYDLMDSAYDADAILAHSRSLNHVPIVAPHPRRNGKSQSILPKVSAPKKAPEMTWAQQDRYKERTSIERVNARLKDEFGGRHIRVRGAAKVFAHLAFGLVALTVDQLLKLTL